MKKIFAKLFDILTTVGIIFCLGATALLLYRNICYDEVTVSGSSMENTLFDGDFGLMRTTKSTKENAKRFEIAVFNIGSQESPYRIIKRIIGLPGETIKIESNGDIKINNEIIEQTFLEENKKTSTYLTNGYACNEEYIIPKDAYFCLGDNRGFSTDSRERGAFTFTQMEGVLRLIYKHCEDNVCKSIPKTWY